MAARIRSFIVKDFKEIQNNRSGNVIEATQDNYIGKINIF